MKITVLAGGLSPERSVSLSTGCMVCQALRERGHQAALIDMFFGLEGAGLTAEQLFTAPIPEQLKRISPQAPDLEQVKASRSYRSGSQFGPGVLEVCAASDVVFLALHGSCGEDGRVQATLDLLGIPYTGSGYLSSAVALDKDLTKRLLSGTGVVTPPWETADCTAEDIASIVERTPLPAVVKPLASGSSIGVYIAQTKDELRQALLDSRCQGSRVVLERYIQGREIQVAILEDAPLPSIEIIPKQGFYDYANKYQPGAAVEVCPAEIPPEWEARIGRDALTAFRALGLSVYARADFIVDEEGTPYFLEINTLPGMTPTSLVPQEAAAAGIGYGELCERILRASLQARQNGG